VLIATGGTAGHIEPALAVADALRELDPDVQIVVLGSERGLESTLVPERGYELVTVPAVPLPRKPNLDLVRLPLRLRRAVRAARTVLRGRTIDVVAGFGGYAALPAYLAARNRIPIVVHEANARAGLANKVGARYAVQLAAAVPGSGLARATVVGNPVRRSISQLDRASRRGEARAFFGLPADGPVVLVTGGSQGAQQINIAVRACAADFAAAGIAVLHHHGRSNAVEPVARAAGDPPYVLTGYIDRMDLAYAAADLLVARSGAMTVAEATAVGLPAVYVPLPHGNGEQRLNATARIDAGAAIAIDNADFTPDAVRRDVIGLIGDRARFETLRAAAAGGTRSRPDLDVARMVLAAAGRPVAVRPTAAGPTPAADQDVPGRPNRDDPGQPGPGLP
jgi:UDP-N-acetylglucosamine--N-acetylmuramyl-(pentapeptide) pyrophosphoryl-undecaprenol N-acetylglucosamine transferase